MIFFKESLIKFCDGSQPNRILNVQVVFGHVHVSMSNQALNRCQVHTKCLHLRNIGMAAAMRSQNPNAFNPFKLFLEFFPEVGRIARLISLISYGASNASVYTIRKSHLLPPVGGLEILLVEAPAPSPGEHKVFWYAFCGNTIFSKSLVYIISTN